MALLDEPLSYEEIIQKAKEDLDPEWSGEALDDGKSVVEANEYEAIAISRDGQTFHEPVTSVSYRPQTNTAHSFKVDIEPDGAIEEEQFLGGDIALFVDRDPLQVGYIETIDLNQNDEDYTIEARPLASRLENQAVQETVKNETVPDLIATTIDEYNEVLAKHENLTGGSYESVYQMQRFAGDILRTFESEGNVYYNVLENTGKVELVNLKAFSNHEFSVWFEVNGDFVHEQVVGPLDSSRYGEWVSFEPPDLPRASRFKIWFVFEGGSRLYDWNILSDVELTRQVDPAEVERVMDGNTVLYRWEGTELEDNVAETTNDQGETIDKKENVYWDGESEKFRLKQARAHYAVNSPVYDALGNPIGTQTGDNREVISDTGATYHESLRIPPDSDQSYESFFFLPGPIIENEFVKWGTMFRVRAPSTATSDDYIWFNVEYQDERLQDGIPVGPSHPDWNGDFDEFNWVRGPTDENYGEPTFSAHDGSEGGQKQQFGIIADGNNTEDIIFDYFSVMRLEHPGSYGRSEHRRYNNIHSGKAHLNGPPLYHRGYVEFDPFESDDNISAASAHQLDDHSVPDPVFDYGPRQRIDENAEFLPNLPHKAPSSDVNFPYPGANHSVKMHMTPYGERGGGTPRRGYNAQTLGGIQVYANTNDLEIFGEYDLDGNRLEIISDVADKSSYTFRWDGTDAQIFKRGTRKADVDLVQEETSSSFSVEDVFSDVKVVGDGVEATAEAPDAPNFVDRTKTLFRPDIDNTQDAKREAVSFIVNNSSIRYSGDITTLPTRVPVGETIDGEHFKHGQDMVIEDARYSKSKTQLSCGFKKSFSDQMIHLARATRDQRRRSTGDSDGN